MESEKNDAYQSGRIHYTNIEDEAVHAYKIAKNLVYGNEIESMDYKTFEH